MWPEDLPEDLRGRFHPERPRWVAPMLARLHDGPLPAGDWVFERKFDGQRVMAVCDSKGKGEVKLVARSGIEVTPHYPEIASSLPDDRPYALDGEMVVFDEHGVDRFSLLQKRMHSLHPDFDVPVHFVVFDCVNLDSMDVRELPYQVRSRLVHEVGLEGRCAPVPHTHGDADLLIKRACEAEWEGLMAKRRDAPYTGRRSGYWLKLKCLHQEGFVIGGFTPPQGSRHGFGALLLGEQTDKGLRYVGKVGTGFDSRELRVLHGGLKKIQRASPPFVDPPSGPVRWVEPILTCTVGYRERTREGRLRQPRFLGLRRVVARRPLA